MRINSLVALLLVPALPANLTAQQDPELRVSSRIVVVDVTVVDKKGHAVTGLSEGDFEISENGKPQTIKGFEEHTVALQPAQPAKQASSETRFVTPAPQEKEPSITAILLDELNTAQQDQVIMREAITHFLKNQPTNVQIAVFGLTNRLALLQPFTTNANLVRRALDARANDSRKGMLQSNRTLTDPALGSQADTFADLAQSTSGGDALRLMQLSINMNQYEGAIKNQQQKISNLTTFQALQNLATYLGALPGKKNLIWFSAGIPILTVPDLTMLNPSDAFNDSRGEVSNLIALFNKGRIAVYPIDPRGTTVPPTFSAQSKPSDPVQRMRIEAQTEERMISQFQTAGILAQKTGGKAFFSRNDLDRATAEVIALGSNYYSIAYIPQGNWDGGFRKLHVSLRDKNYHLAYREGYYATDKAAPRIDEGSAARIESVMKGAMLFGAPSRGDLAFAVDVDMAAEQESDPAPKTELPSGTTGPFKRYRLDYTLDTGNVLFAEHTPGIHEGSVRFLLLLYDIKGNLVASTNNVLVGKLTDKSYQRMLETGIHLHQEISAPQNGTYFARMAVEDLSSGKIGAIEIPLTMKLPPTK